MPQTHGLGLEPHPLFFFPFFIFSMTAVIPMLTLRFF